jgi:hypothetical protein
VGGSLGRHNTLTQLTAEHGNEPNDRPSGWLTSRRGWKPRAGLRRGTPPTVHTTGAAGIAMEGASDGRPTWWRPPARVRWERVGLDCRRKRKGC